MREIFNLNEKWAFSKEAIKPPVAMPQNWYWVNLPHTWNAIDGQDGGNDYYRGTCFYAKEVQKEELPEGEQYYLEFLGVNASADVYVNGNHLDHHDGGYSTWRVNMTDALTDGKNLIVVAVDNSANDRVYPQKADFTFYGGMYRDVNIIAVHKSHFDLDYYGGNGLKVTPEVADKNAKIAVEVFLSGEKAGQQLVYQITDAEGVLAAETKTGISDKQVNLEITDVHLWNGRKDPYLYTATVRLMEDGVCIDSVSTRFGYPLRGVSRHQDRAGNGNALLPEHHREDIDLICEMGATTIRLAHYQHAQYFYDLCDEKGLVLWAEIPYISQHMKNGRENTISQMKELIVQNYNHPSIVVWGLSNEITMSGEADEDLMENHHILNDLAHEMDPTRLTTMAVVSMCDMHNPYIQIPDVVSYNHYFGWYGGDTSMNGPWMDEFHKEFPKIPIGMSEYGCEALNWHTSDPKQGDYTEEYQAHYHEELIKQLYTRPYIWATHVWNMFDFAADARNEGGENGMNHKGLVTFDRKYKKDAFYAYKAWLSDEPFVHICGKRYVDRVENVTKVTVYSNQKTVELFANWESLGKKEASDHFFYFEVPNHGETKLLAVAGECRDESFIKKVEKFNEAYRLKEKGAVLNWFDITAPDGFFSLNDTVGDIMSNEDGNKVMQELFQSFGQAKAQGGGMNSGMMKMLSGFTVLRMINMMGLTSQMTSQPGEAEKTNEVSKEQLLAINDRLNQIRK